ncbi:MAG: hypothetical protein KKF48_04780 [Nanoarchaeota archaeon]|nr:hypothetical protein [Nanoarchaeota archaeon]MBU1028332.1 hypothetical protein [Nanoarchaeota archaeon]
MVKNKTKKTQEQKSKILYKPRKAQEEMVGFTLIIVIVAVILLILLVFSLKKPQQQAVDSHEVEAFIQGLLQYTTDCKDNLEYFSVEKLIYACNRNENCLDERNTCDVLHTTLEDISDQSWLISDSSSIKGYGLNITVNEQELFSFIKGNLTKIYKGTIQVKPSKINIFFSVYY